MSQKMIPQNFVVGQDGCQGFGRIIRAHDQGSFDIAALGARTADILVDHVISDEAQAVKKEQKDSVIVP